MYLYKKHMIANVWHVGTMVSNVASQDRGFPHSKRILGLNLVAD